MRTDIMVDIECLGKQPDATIFQIAAVAFDIETGEYKGMFNEVSDITKDDEVKVQGDTLKWWLNTNKELLTD